MCNRKYKCIVNLKLQVQIQTTAPDFIQIANNKDRGVLSSLTKMEDVFAQISCTLASSDTAGSQLWIDCLHELKIKWCFLVVGLKRVITQSCSIIIAFQTFLGMFSYRRQPSIHGLDSSVIARCGRSLWGGEKGWILKPAVVKSDILLWLLNLYCYKQSSVSDK